MTPFTEKVINVIRKIPRGKVTTYGQIASLASNPRAARQVARILHSMSRTYHLPWHRVVNRHGEVAIKNEEIYQEQLWNLKSEGVEVTEKGKVDLKKYKWVGECMNGEDHII